MGGCGYWPPSLFAFRCNVRKDGWTSCLPAHLATTRRGREIRETVRSSHFDGIGVAWINLNINFRSLVSHCVRRSMLACCSSLSQRHLNYYKVRTELRDSPRSQKVLWVFWPQHHCRRGCLWDEGCAIRLFLSQGLPEAWFHHVLSLSTLVSRTPIIFNVGFRPWPTFVYAIRI